ncbi:WD40 repeat-like protein [Auricularia subglabra TFB-10046 SS5]|nr:WD40 repeat-like protein [Auricularia subglabra TFB-10046 SS5]
MPPRELPGLYWDDARQRYFPLASRPRPAPHTTLQPVLPADHAPRLPSEPLPRIVRRAQSARRPDRASVRHELTAGHWSRATYTIDGALLSFGSHVTATAFGVIPDDPSEGPSRRGPAFAVGCSDGAIFVSRPGRGARRRWQAIHYMQSRVSAICASGPTWITTSFGSPCEIYYSSTPVESALRTVCLSFSSRVVRDVRAAQFDGRLVALGGGGAVTLVDAEEGLKSVFPATSDILTLSFPAGSSEIISGARDGTVRIFDVRLPPKQHAPDILQGRLARLGTSAAHVRIVQDNMLLVASLGGHLETHDLRFMRRRLPSGDGVEPVAVLRGHVNAYAMNVPIVTDPAEDFLFAAGQDRRVRMWSLRTGAPVCPGDSTAGAHFLDREFSSPIVGLHVDAESAQGRGLYVVCEDKIEYFT